MPAKKKYTVRDLVREFCLNTTFQGFKYFYIFPDKISRCFWALNVLGALAFAFILALLLYQRFAQMPTRITIEDQYAPVENLPFPAITICSPNQMTISNMMHFNKTLVDGDLNLNLHSMLKQALGYYEIVPDFNSDELRHLQDLIDINRHFVPVVMVQLAQSCDEFLLRCIYNDELRNCNDIFRPILTKHGVCCIFNSPYYFRDFKNDRDHNFKPFMPSIGGLQGALTVVSDYRPDDAMNRTLLNAGAIRGYRNSDCDIMCFVRAVERACHCTMFYVPEYRMANLCNLTSVPCIMHTKTNLAQNEGMTSCECPRDCDSRHYRVETNTGNMGAIQHMINNPFIGLKINRSTTIMHIAFANSFYVTQKQETVMSLINLVSNLGGVFGLCLGCSAFSILEILFLIYMIIKHRFLLKNDKV